MGLWESQDVVVWQASLDGYQSVIESLGASKHRLVELDR